MRRTGGDAQQGRVPPTAAEGLPRLAAGGGFENHAEGTAGPADTGIVEVQPVDGSRLPGALPDPGVAAIGRMPDEAARPTGNPDGISPGGDRVKIDRVGQSLWQRRGGRLPDGAAAGGVQNEAAIAHQPAGTIRGQGDTTQTAETEFADLRSDKLIVPGQADAPLDAGHNAGGGAGEVGGSPAGLRRGFHGLPVAAAIDSGKNAGGEFRGGIAHGNALLQPEELHMGQPGQFTRCERLPGLPAIAGEQQNAVPDAGVGQGATASHPANAIRQKAQAAERTANRGRQQRPAVAAIGGVPDDPVIAHGPAPGISHELDVVQGGIVLQGSGRGCGTRGMSRLCGSQGGLRKRQQHQQHGQGQCAGSSAREYRVGKWSNRGCAATLTATRTLRPQPSFNPLD